LLLQKAAACLLQGKFVDVTFDNLKLLELILAFIKLFDDLLHQLLISSSTQIKLGLYAVSISA
jgi:hypothetical protein